MTAALNDIERKLVNRIKLLDSAFDRNVVVAASNFQIDRSAMFEGFVSGLWQTWCGFCREILVRSAKGARTASGMLTVSSYSTCTDEEIAYVAKQYSKGASAPKLKAVSGPHQEPTWGDLSKAGKIIGGLNPSNGSTLLSALSVCSSLADLQLCRNASAHITEQSLGSVRTAKVRYNNAISRHPSDMARWIDPATNDYLWKTWIDEIQVAASFAVK